MPLLMRREKMLCAVLEIDFSSVATLKQNYGCTTYICFCKWPTQCFSREMLNHVGVKKKDI